MATSRRTRPSASFTAKAPTQDHHAYAHYPQLPPVNEGGGIGENLPRPDPSFLTTQQLIREIGSLREIIETRISGMDKAIELVREATDKLPAQMAAAIQQLKDVHEEKFKVQEEKFRSISIQFSERDTRTEQTSQSTKVAVDAALQAAKEAVNAQQVANGLANTKMENAFTKQIDQIGVLMTTQQKGNDEKMDAQAKGTDEKIDDLKSSLNNINTLISNMVGAKAGVTEVRTNTTSAMGILIGVAGVVVAIIVAVIKMH